MAQKIYQGGIVTVSTAGTRVQLTSTATRAYAISIQAHPSNTGTIYVGDSTVASSACMAALSAGMSFDIEGTHRKDATDEFIASDYYVDASVNGDKVVWSYQGAR